MVFMVLRIFVRKLELDPYLKKQMDPDPHWEKQLDPDPQKINADPQPWVGGRAGSSSHICNTDVKSTSQRN